MHDTDSSSGELELIKSLADQVRVIPVLRHVAHDLNNSVWSILANLEIVETLVKPDDELTKELLASIETAAQRASGECRRATSLLKTTTAGRELVGLVSIVTDVVQTIKRMTPPNVELTVDPDGEESATACTTFVDVLTMLWCLSTNSISAIGDQSGTIRFEFSKTADASVLLISDDGCGMDMKTLANCREAFDGVDKSALGVGLTAVDETMYSHRGKVEVESTLGVGTKFRLVFPKL